MLTGALALASVEGCYLSHELGDDDAAEPDARAVRDFGTVVGDVGGAVRLWNGGATLPAGRYRVTYVDGCMKYSSRYDWSVNAYADGRAGFWIVGGGTRTRLAVAPGTDGVLAGSGGYTAFDACVAANAADAPVELHFDGGVLGIQLVDEPYTDNVAGEHGRSPTWRLSSCP